MDTGRFHSKAFAAGIGSLFLACLFACPASAGDNVQVVPLFSDDRGNQAWVEIGSTGERMKATPFVAVGREGLRKVLENPNENGCLAIPVPQLMRLIERARQAIREIKRPVAKPPAVPGVATAVAGQPAGPAGKPPETPPDRPESSAPPGVAPPESPPREALTSTATR